MEITGLGAEPSSVRTRALYSYFSDAQQGTALCCLTLFIRKMRILKTQQSGCSEDQISSTKEEVPTYKSHDSGSRVNFNFQVSLISRVSSNVLHFTGRYILSVAVFLESVAVTLKGQLTTGQAKMM